MPWAALLPLLLADEPGFGGAAAPERFELTVPAPAVDEDPEQARLRTRLDAAIRTGPPEAEAPRKRTKLEEELERAHLDATLPLLALRVEVARAELELEEAEAAGRRPEELHLVEQRVAGLRQVSELVERIALARLVRCTRGLGQEVQVKNYRMTAGGPVLLSTSEMIDQLPLGDPQGCERILLVDAELVARARRLFAVRAELASRSFGYFEVAARKALEQEEATLGADLEAQAIPGSSTLNRRP